MKPFYIYTSYMKPMRYTNKTTESTEKKEKKKRVLLKQNSFYL